MSNNKVARKSKDPDIVPTITEEEWIAREHRQQQRIQDVAICLGFISDSISDYKELSQQQRMALKWKYYLDCDRLPRVKYPPEIRKFIDEMRYVEAKEVDGTVSWLLSVDERSILTQNVKAVNLTREVLEQTFRPNIGRLYDEAVHRVLTTLERIEELMACEFETEDIPWPRLLEINEMQKQLNKEIDIIFDKLTYRVVCAPSAYKTYFDDIWESYCYRSPNFNFQLWWIADVPVRFEYRELPLMMATLDCVGVRVQIPMSVLCENLTLRCVHTFFDPYSVDAKSYEQKIDRPSNAGITDIDDCLIYEWTAQDAIMNQTILIMEHKLLTYEENVKEIEARNIIIAKTDNSNNPKLIKIPKEPQILPEGTFPDPYPAFIKQEQEEFAQFLDEFLNPVNLKLKPDEINLRRYKILGGVYSMVFVRKPKHTDFEKFNITFHEDGRVLYSMWGLSAELDPEVDNSERPSKDTPRSRSLGARLTTADIRTRLQHWQVLEPKFSGIHVAENEVPYFFLTFDLPEHLCRYGEPVACQFLEEPISEEDEDSSLQLDSDDYLKRRRTKKRSTIKKRPTLKARKTGTFKNKPNRTSALSLSSDRSRSKEYTLFSRPRPTIIEAKDSIPRNIYQVSILTKIRLSSPRDSNAGLVKIRNFPLTSAPLDIMQLHNMQRHFMPRILSSFKFPMEFKMERYEEFLERNRGNSIIRRHQALIKFDDDEPGRFSFEKQEAPERLFPFFDEYEYVQYDIDSEDSTLPLPKIKDNESTASHSSDQPNEDVGFYEMIAQLDTIKAKYKRHSKRIDEQPNFMNKKNIDVLREDSTSKGRHTVRISMIASKALNLPRSSPIWDTRSNFTEQDFHDLDTTSEISGPQVKTSDKKYKPEKPKVRPTVKHWTTKHIRKMDFNRETLTCTIKTDRLGLFGFAYKRYMHFPFQDWYLQFNESDPNEIIFMLDTHYVRVYLFITNLGIRGYVTKITNEYTARPIKYLEITEPISDYRELRWRFCDKNINIFAERDSCYYIENGYFSEKHVSAELHIYDAFAIHCKLLKFYRSNWNRLATRRDIILCIRNPKDINEGADVTVRVTPENSTFVEITELCSDNLDEFKLHYHLTWRNIGTYSDLHQLINSMYPQATDVRNRDPKLIHYLRTLFTEVKPLSFS